MATKNIEIEKGDWQDLITLGELTLEANKPYAISIIGSKYSEVCLDNSEPADDTKGHPIVEGTNLTFVYDNEKIWIKLGETDSQTAIVVIS